MEGVELQFTEDALDFIVDIALETKLGARGLRTICEAIMTDAMFSVPSEKDRKVYLINKEYAESKLNRTKLTQLKAAS